MFRLTAHINRGLDSLHVAELHAQCALVSWAYAHLRHYCNVVGAERGSSEPLGYAPVDVLAHCTVFLAAVASISKMLFPTGKKFLARGQRLRERLQLTKLSKLESRTVRNAFEHSDERIDELSAKTTTGTVCLIDIGRRAPKQGEIVLKRLDPNARTIEFLRERVDIEACYGEVQLVAQALQDLSRKLRER